MPSGPFLWHFSQWRGHIEIWARSFCGAGVPPAQSLDGYKISESALNRAFPPRSMAGFEKIASPAIDMISLILRRLEAER